MPKVLKSTCRKLWCLSACKKSTSSLTSFLRYCKDIANLLFWELWECLTIPIKIIVSICSMLSCLSACKKSTSSFIYFLRYCREIANLLFWSICTCLATHTYPKMRNCWNYKWQYHFEETLTFISRQKMNFILHIFFTILQRYCKHVVLGTLGMPG